MKTSRIVRKVLIVCAATLLGLLGAELVARGFATFGGALGQRLASRDPLGVVYGPYGNSGYRQRPGLTERFPNGTRTTANSLGYRGPEVRLDKPASTFRIVLLGGSTTNGFGVNDEDTIDAHMRRLLPEKFSGVCYEVVNLALGGYDSYQDYERMRVDGTRFHPDLVILNSGINDVRNAQYNNLSSPPDPRTLIWQEVMQRMREEDEQGMSLKTLANHYLFVARLPGFVRELLQQRGEIKIIRAAEPYDSAVGYFSTNVERTIRIALENGAKGVVLSTPPSALSMRNKPSDPPERSYWIKDAGTTEVYRKKLAARMRDIAAQAQAAGQPVTYVSHNLHPDEFLDDAHLTSAGNLTVARNLSEAALPFIRKTFSGQIVSPDQGVGRLSCRNES